MPGILYDDSVNFMMIPSNVWDVPEAWPQSFCAYEVAEGDRNHNLGA